MATSGSKIGSMGGAGLGFALSGGNPMGAAIGSFLGGTIGGLLDEGPDVQAYLEQMAKLYEGIVPPDLAKAIVYAQYKQGGTLTPQQLSQLPIEAQQAVQLYEKPEFKQRQQVQLQQMEQLARTGMGPQELLALEQSRRAAATDAQARFKSILQQYQQMGQAGGGASLAASLQASQSADDREAMTNMQAAAMAAENRRNAIQQAFSAASGMRQQDLQVNQYNTENLRQKQMFDIQNALSRQQQNAQYANQANIFNLQRQQQVMDMNMKQYNEELYRQQYLAPQQMYMNQMALANAKAGVLAQKAGLAQQQAQAQSQSDMNFMMGLGQMGMGFANMQQNKQMMQMYGAKEGLVQDSSGNWSKPIPDITPPPVQTPNVDYSTRQSFNPQYPIMGGPPNFSTGGFDVQQQSAYNNPQRFSLGAFGTPMGSGGNQAGLNYGLPPINYNLGYNPMLNWYRGTGGF